VVNNIGILFTKASCSRECHTGILGVEAKLHAFITAALDRDEWSASYPKHFTACGKRRHYPLHGSLGMPHSQLGCCSKVSFPFQKLSSLLSFSPFSCPYINYVLKLTTARYICNKCPVTVSITANILLHNETLFPPSSSLLSSSSSSSSSSCAIVIYIVIVIIIIIITASRFTWM